MTRASADHALDATPLGKRTREARYLHRALLPHARRRGREGLGRHPHLPRHRGELVVRHRVALNRFSHLFVLVMGAWYLWRGFAPLPPG